MDKKEKTCSRLLGTLLTKLSTIVHNTPVLRTGRRLSKEDTLGIILLAYLQQSGVVASPVRFLPVRLIEIALVHITRTSGTHIPESLTQDIGVEVLAFLPNLPGLVACHHNVGDDEATGVAPRGVNSIVDLGISVAGVNNVTDVETELGGLGHGGVDESVGDIVAVGANVGLCKEAAADDGLLVRGLVFEHVNVELEERGEGASVGVVRHFSCV